MKTITFGVLVKHQGDLKAFLVPIDQAGQGHIEHMFEKTQAKVASAQVQQFQLAEKYSDDQCAKLDLSDPLAETIKGLFDATSVEVNPDVLDDMEHVVAYFGAIEETNSPKRLGIRQARTFKSLRTKPVWTFAEGQLTEDKRPKVTLSDSWELLTEGKGLFIVSATALERICDLAPAIRKSAIDGLAEISPNIPFLNMEPLIARVEGYTRSARIVADLQKRGDLAVVSETALKNESDKQGIEYEIIDHKYMVKVGSEEGLLMLLDRRRYADPLVAVNPDIYEADSRHKVGKARP
ncbi:MAG: hypothetical protein KF857_08560 [Fimbriimonadaceae bacterium]|nr:hypothetical protein [Fimbriimonadaceae bacterium]